MTTDGRAVANFILDYCDQKGRKITHVSLQKIVFFCHVWSLVIRSKPLIRHRFEAWKYGPVLPYLYRDFREFGDDPIKGRASSINPTTGEREIATYDLDCECRELLSRVVDFYIQVPASQLIQLTHVRGGPWHKVWNHEGTVNPGMKISDEDIMEFYSRTLPTHLMQ